MQLKFYPLTLSLRNFMAAVSLLFIINLHAQTVVTTNPNSWSTTNVVGDLTITGDLITDLSGMNGASKLSTVSGNLTIENLTNPNLFNLNGLQSLALVEGNLIIRNCNGANFTSLLGLQGLFTVQGDLIIENCNNLGNLIQLASVMTIGGELRISENASLSSMGPSTPWNLTNVSDVFIGNNPGLTGIDPFQNVTNTGVIEIRQNANLNFIASFNNLVSVENLLIIHNDKLSSIVGFENIQTINYLEINNNSILSACCFATHLIEKAVAPTAILANAVGCESVAVVNAPPQFDICPPSASVEVAANTCVNDYPVRLPNGFDNCDFASATVKITLGDGSIWFDGVYGSPGSTFTYPVNPGTNTFAFLAADAVGNTTECNTIITVQDNESPKVIPGLLESQFTLDAEPTCSTQTGEAYATFTFIGQLFTDNCSLESHELEIEGPEGTQHVNSGSEGFNYSEELGLGDYRLTFRTIDFQGNQAQFISEFTIQDMTPPTWDDGMMAKTVEIECGTMTLAEAITVNSPTASDCASVFITNGGSTTITSVCGLDIEEISLFAFDANGNTTVDPYVLTIEFIDASKPILSGVPPDITIGCNDNIPAFPNVTAIDACDGNLTNEITFSQVPGMGSCGNGVVAETFRNTASVQDACGNVTEKVWNVTVVSDFSFSLGEDIEVCDGGSNLILNPGVQGQTYSWSTGANTSTISVNQSGTYALTITTSNGCCFVDQVNVTNGELPNVTAQGGIITCGESSIMLSGSSTTPNVTYSWTGPSGFTSTIANPMVTASGNYTLTVSTLAGCLNEVTVSVNSDTDVPNAEATGGIISCSSPTIEIKGTSSTPGVSFSWTGPDNFTSEMQNPLVTNIGTYTLIVTSSNGCSQSTSIEVEGNSDIPELTLFGGELNCLKDTLRIELESNLSLLETMWTGPSGFTSTEAEPLITSPGIYEVKVIGVNGCPASFEITIAENVETPELSIQGGTISCADNSTSISVNTSTPDATFAWTGPDNFRSDSQNPVVSQPGVYTIKVTGVNGCFSTDSVEVSADTNLPQISASSGMINCLNETATISGTTTNSGATFSWEGPNGFSSSQGVNQVAEAGIYTFTVVAESGCIAFKSVEVVIDNLNPDLMISEGAVLCSNGTRQFIASSSSESATFLWEGPAGFVSEIATPNYSIAGSYFVTVTSANGCSSIVEYIVENNVVLEAEIMTSGTTAEVIISSGTGPFSFLWDGELGAESQTLSEGSHILKIVDGLGCIYDYEVIITTSSIDEIDASAEITIFPNPVLDMLNVRFESIQIYSELKIFDINGKQVSTRTISGVETELSVAHLEAGIYVMKIIYDGILVLKRFIKHE